MKRREFISLIGGAAAAGWPLVARAQQPERMRRVGVLHGFAESDPQAASRVAALQRELRELGWVEGRNIRLDYRWAGDASQAQAHAKELVAMAPDAILAHATPELVALRQETRTIPIVFVAVIDPVGQGFVSNLARPGENITGFTNYESTIGGKWLEMLKEIAPGIARVALLYNPDTAPFFGFFQHSVEEAASIFAVEAIALRVRDAVEIERAIEAFAIGSNAGIIILPDNTTFRHRDLIIRLAVRHRLPAIYPFRYFATSGGLIYYGIDVLEDYRGAASYIDRILRGANPGDLPIQAPTKFELLINLKTAKALGLEIPPSLLALADEVIE
jgi:putative ABC transport system substrate-binding protein